ncbi:NAD(P)-binding domain-containing protein [Candidatus Woesebacteria bacterium]|nr:NAD(P)-binding domain-containing protein [Candidatus Woesebacteria bacterium]
MNIVHLDVDKKTASFLNKGDIFSYSISQIPDDIELSYATVLTLKHTSPVNKQTLKAFPHVKLIITRTAGFNHIDLDYCKKQGITVYRIPDYGAFNIAEHAMALVFAGAKNIIQDSAETKQGIFAYEHHLSLSLKDKVIGIVGTGRIGREMIKLSAGVGMNILAYDVSPDSIAETKASFDYGYEYVQLEELLMSSDVVSLHVPLSDETHHLINDNMLSLMKKGSILINTARGEIIDEQALVKHIKKFHFVGLDVVENEQHFRKDNPLLAFDNVVITPHAAFFSDYSVKKIGEETMRLIQLFHDGKEDHTSLLT